MNWNQKVHFILSNADIFRFQFQHICFQSINIFDKFLGSKFLHGCQRWDCFPTWWWGKTRNLLWTCRKSVRETLKQLKKKYSFCFFVSSFKWTIWKRCYSGRKYFANFSSRKFSGYEKKCFLQRITWLRHKTEKEMDQKEIFFHLHYSKFMFATHEVESGLFFLETF